MKMKRTYKKFIVLLAVFCFILTATSNFTIAETYKYKSTNVSKIIQLAPKNFPNIKWVSIKDIKKELHGKKPTVVGFDIDDTVLLSSPCFYKLQNEFIRSHHLSKNISNGKLFSLINKDKPFWNKLAVCDDYSLPKQSAINLIRMHQKRGDQIYFITARHAPFKSSLEYNLNKIIIHLVGSRKGLHKVIYSNNKSKTPFIKKHNITIYYGDSDNDIIDARKAGAVGIRFLRSSTSTYKPLPLVGKLGEQVLENSDH